MRELQFQVDPGVAAGFASARRGISDTLDNPLGAYTTPAVREATERAAYGDLAQQEGAATNQASYQNQGLDLARKEDLAQMTAPRIVQSGGSSSGYNTQLVQQPSILNSAIGGAASVGAAAL